MYQQPKGDFKTEISSSSFKPEMENSLDSLLKMFIWDEKHIS